MAQLYRLRSLLRMEPGVLGSVFILDANEHVSLSDLNGIYPAVEGVVGGHGGVGAGGGVAYAVDGSEGLVTEVLEVW